MSIFSGMNINATALTAERLRMDIISKNIANAQTTRTKNGLPYKRQVAVFKEAQGDNSFKSVLENKRKKDTGGVEVVGIVEDKSDFKLRYDQGHPDADENGYVKMPNVELIKSLWSQCNCDKYVKGYVAKSYRYRKIMLEIKDDNK